MTAVNPSELDPSELDPSDLDPSDLDPQMTVAEAAEAMAALLRRTGDRGDDEQW